MEQTFRTLHKLFCQNQIEKKEMAGLVYHYQIFFLCTTLLPTLIAMTKYHWVSPQEQGFFTSTAKINKIFIVPTIKNEV